MSNTITVNITTLAADWLTAFDEGDWDVPGGHGVTGDGPHELSGEQARKLLVLIGAILGTDDVAGFIDSPNWSPGKQKQCRTVLRALHKKIGDALVEALGDTPAEPAAEPAAEVEAPAPNGVLVCTEAFLQVMFHRRPVEIAQRIDSGHIPVRYRLMGDLRTLLLDTDAAVACLLAEPDPRNPTFAKIVAYIDERRAAANRLTLTDGTVLTVLAPTEWIVATASEPAPVM